MKPSLVALCGALFCASLLNAGTIIFTNFGSGVGYNSGTGLTAGPGAAVPFTDTAVAPDGFVYVLTSIEVAFVDAVEDPGSDSVTVALYSNNNGVPGTQLASQSFLAATSPTIETVTFADGPILSNGTEYWVALFDDGNGLWNSSDTGAQGAATYSTVWSVQVGDPQGAAEVDASLVAPVPEPGTLAMFGGGFFALILFAARRRFTAQAV